MGNPLTRFVEWVRFSAWCWWYGYSPAWAIPPWSPGLGTRQEFEARTWASWR